MEIELSLKEILSSEIREHFREILFSADIIQWYEKHQGVCDELIMKIYNKRNTETHWMTPEEAEAWDEMPEKVEESVLKMIANQFNSKTYSIIPQPFPYLVKKKQREIPIRRELINELRRIRDNGIGEILNDYSKNCTEEKWENTTETLRKLIEENWKAIAKLTIKLNNSVMFVNKWCPQFWRELTYEWSKDYFVC